MIRCLSRYRRAKRSPGLKDRDSLTHSFAANLGSAPLTIALVFFVLTLAALLVGLRWLSRLSALLSALLPALATLLPELAALLTLLSTLTVLVRIVCHENTPLIVQSTPSGVLAIFRCLKLSCRKAGQGWERLSNNPLTT